ncbi:OLAH, partial [Symbiodinium sp. CCMP2456]
ILGIGGIELLGLCVQSFRRNNGTDRGQRFSGGVSAGDECQDSAGLLPAQRWRSLCICSLGRHLG